MNKHMTEAIRHIPKVVLHDHLDGGLRPTTVIELAEATDTTSYRRVIPMRSNDSFLMLLMLAHCRNTSLRLSIPLA